MKKAIALIWIAHYMPSWMWGREFLVKIAIGYMLLNAMAKSTTLEA
jgi:hypothetical protein